MGTKREAKAARHRGRAQPAPPAVPEQDEPASATPADPADPPLAGPNQRKRKRDKVEEASEEPAAAPRPSKKRFVIFVGQLPFDVTTAQIEAHFEASCGEKPSVRLLTPKSADPAKPSKGMAFCEFTASEPLKAALQLHQSKLGGRRINVELSAGGGGSGEARREKIARSRKRLEQQRAKSKLVAVAAAQASAAPGGAPSTSTAPRPAKRPRKAEAPRPPKSAPKPKRAWLTGSNSTKLG